MAQTMPHRGPDGIGGWNDGPAGLGHLMLHSTPESLHEKLPLVGAGGDLVITADARIDNWDELIKSLDLNSRPSQEITDSELILLAYERWGEDCPKKLDGDFTFVIWDKRRQLMFCARDHFGMKPFYYYASGRVFAFASEIKGLLALPEVPRRVNETRVADFYANIFEDKEVTFYADILRLPPAHCLVVGRDEVRRWTYWSLDPSRKLRLGSDEEYGEAYRQVFTEAVHARLRSALPVGSTLSGGLDSSSIVCVSREALRPRNNGRLQTFSCIFDDPAADERRYINVILNGGDLEPHNVLATGVSPFTDLDKVLWHLDQPYLGMNLYLHWSMAASAREHGVRVLLDGVYGDGTVSWGFGLMSELARKGRWLALNREARELARTAKIRRRDVLMRFAVKPSAEEARRIWRRLRGRKIDPLITNPLINPDLARRVSLEDRWATVQADRSHLARDSREEHWRTLTTGLMPLALELGEAVSAAHRVDWRGPFLDRRLAEFCLSLPGEQKLHKGWTRVVARRALANIMPDEIRWRRDKGGFEANLLTVFRNQDSERFEQTALKEGDYLGQYLDMAELAATHHRFLDTPNIADAMTLFRTTTLATWLKTTQLTP
jgi:asparagine synthase (glutamine-hydrolysing)